MVDPATILLNIVFILGLKDVLQFSVEIMTTLGCGSRALNSVMAKHMTSSETEDWNIFICRLLSFDLINSLNKATLLYFPIITYTKFMHLVFLLSTLTIGGNIF